MLSTRKLITAAILALLCSCSPNNSTLNISQFNLFQNQSDASSNTLVIPGKQVGAVNGKTNRADLVKIFGESKLKDDVLLEDEGTISTPVTKVNLGGEKYFTVVWEDNTKETLLYIRDFGSVWKTPEGIGVGTSFKELREKLGDFKLYGLGWDSGGTINLEGTKLDKYLGSISIKVAADEKAAEKNLQKYQAILSDAEFSSDNPIWELLDTKVSQMTIQFDE